MPLSQACLPGSSPSAAEDHTSSTATDPAAPPPPPPRTLHLSSSTAPDYSSFSNGTAANSSTVDSASPITLPSLQYSLASSLLDPPPFSASFACLSSLHTPDGAPAAVAVVAPSLLYSASAAEISIYDLASLRRLDSFPATPAAGSVKSVAFSADGRAFTAHQDGRIRSWKRSGRSGRYHLVTSLPTAADPSAASPSPPTTSPSAATRSSSGSSTPTPSPPSPPPAASSTPSPGIKPSRSGAPPTSAASNPWWRMRTL